MSTLNCPSFRIKAHIPFSFAFEKRRKRGASGASPLVIQTPLPDVNFGTNTTDVQFRNSTFIGTGVIVNESTDTTFDNCHFIGCGGSEAAQIIDYGTYMSVTRCTDQSFVNDITCPGGNVEYDNADRLLDAGDTTGYIYAGDNTTSGLYLSYAADHGLNGGEQIMTEPIVGYTTDVAVYQNMLSGDGAESFLDNGCGVGVGGVNAVVDDNDISDVTAGVEDWYAGTAAAVNSFEIYSDNSIHNVYAAFSLKFGLYSGSQNVPCFLGNVFSGNTINGIRIGPNGGGLSPAAFYLVVTAGETNDPPQVLMNVFDGNTVTGASIGIEMVSPLSPFGGQIGTLIVSNSLFDTNGSVETYNESTETFAVGSFWVVDDSGDTVSPINSPWDFLEGYWII